MGAVSWNIRSGNVLREEKVLGQEGNQDCVRHSREGNIELASGSQKEKAKGTPIWEIDTVASLRYEANFGGNLATCSPTRKSIQDLCRATSDSARPDLSSSL